MIPIIITGAAGRMGKTLVGLVCESKDFRLVGATEYSGSSSIGKDAGQLAGGAAIGVPLLDSLEKIPLSSQKGNPKPVIIDFTSPEATRNHLQVAVDKGLSLVIGTTGLGEADIKLIKNASKKIPIVLSPNMSVGVNVMLKLVSEASQILGKNHEYDIEIIEAHHRLKKDAPSGTAVRIAEVVADATGRKYPQDFNFHREGIIGERNPKEIGMQVIRGGDIVGEHTVFFCGAGERIEIKHVATDRKNFAKGALRAAAWLVNKPSGLYDMQDVLGLKK